MSKLPNLTGGELVRALQRAGFKLQHVRGSHHITSCVAAALYRAGLHDGIFSIERLFDVLFSSGVHMHAMMASAECTVSLAKRRIMPSLQNS